MTDLPANIVLEKNKIATSSAWLVLLEITLTDSTVFRLVRNTEDIVFGGNTYTAFNFQLEPTTQTNSGEIPTVTLQVSNISRLIESKLQDLDGGIGSSVKITVVNSDLLTEDYSELELEYDVLACSTTNRWVSFVLGSPSPLRQRFPLTRYIGLLCSFRFESRECNYDRKDVDDVTLSNPVNIESTAHGFLTGDSITLYTLNGITGGLEGTYDITKVDADNFTLDGINGADYGGVYTSGGEVGYSACPRTLTACRERENEDRFGGFPGMRSGSLRVVGM